MINTFTIYPEHCNPIKLGDHFMVHGGQLLMIADRNAALVCKDLLKKTELYGLTVGVSGVQFYRGPRCGETLIVHSNLKTLGTSRISIEVKMFDEFERKVFEGIFSFCSFWYDEELEDYILGKHGLTSSDAL